MNTRFNIYTLLYVSLLCLLSLFLLPFATFAQESSSEADIEISPHQYPLAGENFTAQLVIPNMDIETALITWHINGELITQAYEAKTQRLKASDAGSIMRITVTAEDGFNNYAHAEKIIRVSDVAVVWEGDTYVHPFFAGRSLQSPGSDVILKALPTITNSAGNVYDVDDLYYTWTSKDSRTVFEEGKGKHTVILKNQVLFNEMEILLLIKDTTGTDRVEKNIHIPVTPPEVQLYKNNPLIGVDYSTAIGGKIGLHGEGIEVVAEPYYMSAESRNDSVLEYAWILNGKEDNHRGVFFLDPDNISTAQESTTVPLRTVIKNSLYWLQSTHIDKSITVSTKDTWLDN